MGSARINYLFVYDDGCKSHMVANLDINTTSVDVQLVRNSPLLRGGARGKRRGAGTGASALPRPARRCAASQPFTFQSVVLTGVVPGRETLVMDGRCCRGIDGCGMLWTGWKSGEMGQLFLPRRIAVTAIFWSHR